MRAFVEKTKGALHTSTPSQHKARALPDYFRGEQHGRAANAQLGGQIHTQPKPAHEALAIKAGGGLPRLAQNDQV